MRALGGLKSMKVSDCYRLSAFQAFANMLNNQCQRGYQKSDFGIYFRAIYAKNANVSSVYFNAIGKIVLLPICKNSTNNHEK